MNLVFKNWHFYAVFRDEWAAEHSILWRVGYPLTRWLPRHIHFVCFGGYYNAIQVW